MRSPSRRWSRWRRMRSPARRWSRWRRMRSPARRWSRWRFVSSSGSPSIGDRLFRFAEGLLRLGNGSTWARTARSALVFPFGPSTVAVLTPAVQRSVIHPPRGSWFLAGPETHKASQSLAARHLRPQGNDFTGSHAYVACEFTLCLLAARHCDIQQNLVCLIHLSEALLSVRFFVDVGVVLESQPAERMSDHLIRGTFAYSQNLVVNTYILRATCWWSFPRPRAPTLRTSTSGRVIGIPAWSIRHGL